MPRVRRANGVHESARRDVIGIDVGKSESEGFWREFLRGLRARGLLARRLQAAEPDLLAFYRFAPEH